MAYRRRKSYRRRTPRRRRRVAKRFTRRVRRAVNRIAELKYYSHNYNADPGTSPLGYQPFSGIVQGDTKNTRTGDSIFVKYIHIWGNVDNYNAASTSSQGWMGAFLLKGQHFLISVAGDFANDPNPQYDTEKYRLVRLKRFQFNAQGLYQANTITQAQTFIKQWHMRIPFNKYVRFANDGTTVIQNNLVIILQYDGTTTYPPEFNINTKIFFTDV